MRRVAALVLGLAFPSVVAGQAESGERFELYTGCRPVHAITTVTLSENSQDTMEDALKAVAEASLESRLRAADLWWSWPERGLFEGGPVPLFVTITVDPTFPPNELKLYDYEVRLRLNKQLTDEFGNQSSGTHTTWARGIRSGWDNLPRSEQDVLDAVSSALGRLMDQFLAGYLRVNAPAC